MSEIEGARPAGLPSLPSSHSHEKKADIVVEHDEELGYIKEDERDLTRDGAIAAEAAEQTMTFTEAFRDYKAAVFWSLAISLCIIMEGYDTALPVCPRTVL